MAPAAASHEHTIAIIDGNIIFKYSLHELLDRQQQRTSKDSCVDSDSAMDLSESSHVAVYKTAEGGVVKEPDNGGKVGGNSFAPGSCDGNSSNNGSDDEDSPSITSSSSCGSMDEAESSSTSSVTADTTTPITASLKSEEPTSLQPRRSLFFPYWTHKESKTSFGAMSASPRKQATCFKSASKPICNSPVYIPKMQPESIDEGAPRMVFEMATPAPTQYGRSIHSSSRRSIFSQGRHSFHGSSSCDETASLSGSSSIGSQSDNSIATLPTSMPESPLPRRRHSAPSPSCIRTSRFSNSERGTACTPKSPKVSFDQHVEVVHFTPPQERWSQVGWENYFAS